MSVRQRINATHLDSMSKKELLALIDGLRLDIGLAHARITQMAQKLDLDAGVTDTNYASTNPTPTLNIQP